MRSILLLAAVLALVPALARADDGNPVAGRKKALQCQACHGMDGIAKIPEASNLAGQSTIYLTASLEAYKTGARKNDMMSTIAPNLSEADIADLAAYYSSIEISAKVPGH